MSIVASTSAQSLASAPVISSQVSNPQKYDPDTYTHLLDFLPVTFTSRSGKSPLVAHMIGCFGAKETDDDGHELVLYCGREYIISFEHKNVIDFDCVIVDEGKQETKCTIIEGASSFRIKIPQLNYRTDVIQDHYEFIVREKQGNESWKKSDFRFKLRSDVGTRKCFFEQYGDSCSIENKKTQILQLNNKLDVLFCDDRFLGKKKQSRLKVVNPLENNEIRALGFDIFITRGAELVGKNLEDSFEKVYNRVMNSLNALIFRKRHQNVPNVDGNTKKGTEYLHFLDVYPLKFHLEGDKKVTKNVELLGCFALREDPKKGDADQEIMLFAERAYVVVNTQKEETDTFMFEMEVGAEKVAKKIDSLLVNDHVRFSIPYEQDEGSFVMKMVSKESNQTFVSQPLYFKHKVIIKNRQAFTREYQLQYSLEKNEEKLCKIDRAYFSTFYDANNFFKNGKTKTGSVPKTIDQKIGYGMFCCRAQDIRITRDKIQNPKDLKRAVDAINLLVDRQKKKAAKKSSSEDEGSESISPLLSSSSQTPPLAEDVAVAHSTAASVVSAPQPLPAVRRNNVITADVATETASLTELFYEWLAQT